MSGARDMSLAEINATIGAPAALPGRRPFELVRADRLTSDPRPISWLWRDRIECGSIGAIIGPPGAAKSLIAVALGMACATGQEFCGQPTKDAPVVYIAGEGHGGIPRRLRAWAKHHATDLTDAPFFVSRTAARFCDTGSLAEVLAALDDVEEGTGKPALIVVDTLARNFGPGNESDNTDMGNFISNVDALRDRYGAAALIVHHTGHADKGRARGASALLAALDFEFLAERHEGGPVTVRGTKAKDGELLPPLTFELVPIEIDQHDEDGRPVTSVALREIDTPPRRNTAGLGSVQTRALSCLRDLYDEARANLRESDRDPDGARIDLGTWRQRAESVGIHDRRAFHKVKEALHTRGLIRMDGPHVLLSDEIGT